MLTFFDIIINDDYRDINHENMALDLKILILSDANSIHTLKWVESIREHHANLMLFSLFKPKKDYLKRYIKLNVDVKTPDLKSKIRNIRNPNLSKLNYLIGIRQLKKNY